MPGQEPEIDHENTPDPVCPACGSSVGDAWEWCTNEMRGAEHTCFDCGALFRAFPSYDVTYTTELISLTPPKPED